MIFHGPDIYTVVTEVRWLCRGPCTRGEWAQCPGREACLLSPQIRIKEETRLVSIIDQIDKAVAIIPRGALFKSPFGPTHVNRTFEGEFSDASLMGRRTSFLSIARHTCGSLCKTAHFLRKETAVITSGERMCPVTWHRWLPQSLDPASFLPEGGRAFGHLGLKSFHGSGLSAFPHLPPHWSLLIAGSGPNFGRGNTIPSSPFSSVSS